MIRRLGNGAGIVADGIAGAGDGTAAAAVLVPTRWGQVAVRHRKDGNAEIVTLAAGSLIRGEIVVDRLTCAALIVELLTMWTRGGPSLRDLEEAADTVEVARNSGDGVVPADLIDVLIETLREVVPASSAGAEW